MEQNHGFILTSNAYDQNNQLTLSYWVTNGDENFKVEFTEQKHTFFIPHDSQFNPSDIKFERKESALKSFNHQKVDIVYLYCARDINKVKSYLETQRLRYYELDVMPTERFLMERFIFGLVEIKGAFRTERGIKTYTNPEIRPFTKMPEFKIASLDIETGVAGELYSFAIHQTYQQDQKNIVHMLTDTDSPPSEGLIYHSSEKNLLLAFKETLQLWDPDIIIGWHVIGFDLMFLEKKFAQFNLKFDIARDSSTPYLSERKGAGFFANMTGRVVLDGPPVLRSAFYQFKNFKLDTVASEVLGVGKDIAGDDDKVSEIERRFKEDKVSLAKYNLLDCSLVTDIFKKLNLIQLLSTRATISGMLLDRLNISTAAFDHHFLPKLHRKKYVAPNRIDIQRAETTPGGMVLEPTPGLHKNVTIFDFKSLYPSIIRTFHIDPYSRIQNQTDTITTPKGFEFSQTESILPEIIHTLLIARQKAKDQHNPSLSQAIKILMNSFYGIMGSTRCRFYHTDLADAITSTGHFILKAAIKYFEDQGHTVLYGDTDSIFVALSSGEPHQLAKQVDQHISKLIKDQFHIKSFLECEYEKTYDQIYFSMTRSGEGAAKKRYAGIIDHEIEFKGMEFVRSDWTELAKRFQKELYQKFFNSIDLEEYIKEFIANLEMGLYDEQLVYTKRLSKAPEEYTKNIPPHVKAALLIDHKGPYRLKEVSYVITKLGPIPIQQNPRNYDYQHYIERQLRPIADDILHYQHKSFDAFITGDQLSLF